MHKYRLIGKKGEGTFSEVLKAQGIKNGKYVAIKCMKNHFDSLDQVNNLREIQALRRLSPHPGVIKLCEVLYDQPTRRLALVFELMDMNIYELIRGRRQYLQEQRIKNYMFQLLKSMDHMHRNGIFHRDIKPENILITDDELKLADFGSCRGIYSKQPYTEYISTRWYRAPECLLTDGYYNYKMDMWGVGCVFFEVLSLYPLFPGTNELDQITKIHQILGTPPAETLAKLKKHSNSHIDFNFPHKEAQPMTKLIPHCTADCIDIIVKLLAYDPDDRLSARQAVKHPYFKELRASELKEKQAEGADGADAMAPAAGSAMPQAGSSNKSAKGSEGSSSMLPSIDSKSNKGARSNKGKSNELDSYNEPQPPSDVGAPSAQPAPPYVHASEYGGDEAGGTLPPIGGFSGLVKGSGAKAGAQGGPAISGKSLGPKGGVAAHGRTGPANRNLAGPNAKAASISAKGGASSSSSMSVQGCAAQQRSVPSCADPDVSSTHGSSQLALEGDGGLKGNKVYRSPYSHRQKK